MARKDPYREFLKQDFNDLFEKLELKDIQRHYLRARWLDQVLWMEGRAGQARDRYYKLRLTAIIGGIIIPILVGLNINDPTLNRAVRWTTVGLGGIVAVTAAVEEFFHYGERWRHYRRSAESLKTQAWQFFQLAGPYAPYSNHADAFGSFASEVEEVIQRDVEVYATSLTKVKQEEGKPEGNQNEYVAVSSREVTRRDVDVHTMPMSRDSPPAEPLAETDITIAETGDPGISGASSQEAVH
jgi:hypothetical protein